MTWEVADGFDVPAPLTTFVGRARELASIADAMSTSRLVSLVGPGGCGKTRLAGEVVGSHHNAGTRRPRWIDLTQTTDPAAVSRLVAEAAGVLATEGSASLAAAARSLAGEGSVLILDNCEHLLDGAAAVVETMLKTGEPLNIVTTSREPLSVAGEHIIRIPPMDETDAVALFLARAAQASPVEAGMSEVREACARLDGIPLAVELAAAWSGTLSLREILAGLDDRFGLLVRGPRGLATRHQTLLASMDWSHSHLTRQEQMLFRRLAAFHGAFTLTAAQKVCGYGELDGRAVLAGMRRLVEASLVLADTSGSPTRYRMLETIREYSFARLDASDECDLVRTRHLEVCVQYMQALAPLLDADLDAWRERVVAEEPNLHAAVEYGLSCANTSMGRELAAELPFHWHLGRRGAEGLAVLGRAVAAGAGECTRLQARLLVGVALVADTTSPLGREYDAAQEAWHIADHVGDRRTSCLALLLSAVGSFYTDFEAGLDLAEQARVQAAEIGYLYVRDGALALIGIIAHLRDEHAEAVRRLREAVSGLTARSERGISSTALSFMALSKLYTGHLAHARRLASKAVETAQPLGDYHRVGSACAVLATVEIIAGRSDVAWKILRPVLTMVAEAADPPFVPGLARTLGHLHMREGHSGEAVAWYARESGRSDAVDTYLSPEARVAMASAMRMQGDSVRAEGVCRHALEIARAIGLPRVEAECIFELALLTEPTDHAGAESLLHESLQLRLRHNLWPATIESLEALAWMAWRAESYHEAARVLGACQAARARWGYPGQEAEPGLEQCLVEVLGSECYQNEAARGRELDVPAVAEYVRRARGRRGRPSTGWESLTPTEWQVVQLAAEGLTNPAIGQRLFMSLGTVKTHLSHSYAKLSVENRTELATVVAAERLSRGAAPSEGPGPSN